MSNLGPTQELWARRFAKVGSAVGPTLSKLIELPKAILLFPVNLLRRIFLGTNPEGRDVDVYDRIGLVFMTFMVYFLFSALWSIVKSNLDREAPASAAVLLETMNSSVCLKDLIPRRAADKERLYSKPLMKNDVAEAIKDCEKFIIEQSALEKQKEVFK